jgi:hypothetical protein
MSLGSQRHLAWLTAAALLAAAIAGASVAAAAASADLTAAAAQHGATATDSAHAGIWKAVMPPSGSMHGEFDSNDPLGLAAGATIPADCSINWVDPDYGKLYCFSSATSLVYFLDSPRAFLDRAQKNWAATHRSH